jgi:hypothetical protein
MIRSKDFALQGAGYFGMQATQVSSLRLPGHSLNLMSLYEAVHNWLRVE